ncbi:MAG: hypothetical protein Q7R78_03080, partial [bacterium]|nr:hypothetical protein [bacterium]
MKTELENIITPPESNREVLVNKINSLFETLGSFMRWKKTPEFLAEYEPLKGKKIILLDDVQGVLEGFIPFLSVATDGNFSFIHYKGQSPEEISKEIIDMNPDIALIDSLLGSIPRQLAA